MMRLALVVVEIDVQIIEADSACQKHYFADIISIFIEGISGCNARTFHVLATLN